MKALIGFLLAATVGIAAQFPAKTESAAGGSATHDLHVYGTLQKSLAPSWMTPEEAFFYYCAVYDVPPDVVDRYGRYFDGDNYRRSMADEFRRTKYRDQLDAKIAAAVKAVNFDKRFTLTASSSHSGYTSLGEYSFANHAFPVTYLPSTNHCLHPAKEPCAGDMIRIQVFDFSNAVNKAAFDLALPMSAASAEALLATRTSASGVNRRVTTRITYSIMNRRHVDQVNLYGDGYQLIPFIHSIEVFTDDGLRTKIGELSKRSTQTVTTPESVESELRRLRASRDEPVPTSVHDFRVSQVLVGRWQGFYSPIRKGAFENSPSFEYMIAEERGIDTYRVTWKHLKSGATGSWVGKYAEYKLVADRTPDEVTGEVRSIEISANGELKLFDQGQIRLRKSP